jgi:hypothetical protein
MAASMPRQRADGRRRPRRGTIQRPISGRIYRASWVLVALPLLVLAFTIARPDPLPAATLPPSFETEAARQLTVDFAQNFANRTPGTQTAEDAAGWVEEHLAAYNLNVERQTFQADVPGLGTVQLTNLVARPFKVGPARSSDEIVVVAHRDNLGITPGANDNASGTAALIELARNLSTVSLSHTVVFVSTDGGAWGNIGAAHLAADPAFTDGVLAVVNLDALAGLGPPRVELGGDEPRSPAPVLLATTDASVAAETGTPVVRPPAADQLLHLAFPFNLYDQSPFLGHGVSALTLTSAGDRPPDPATDTSDAIDPVKLGLLGRSAQALVQSLDGAAEVARGTDSYVAVGGRLIRGFAIEFVLLVALLPPALATIDFAARMLRRGVSFAPALRSLRSRLLVWLFAGGVAAVFAFVGIFPRGDGRPLPLDSALAQDWPLGAILGLGAISAAGWFVARVRLVPHGRVLREDELAAHAVMMLALCAVSAVLAVWNPYSLLLVLPSLHAWLWLPHVLDRPALARAALYAIGFLPIIGLFVSFAVRYGLGFDAPWYVATLFSVGYASPVLYVTFLVWAAIAGLAGAIGFGRYAPYPRPGTVAPGPVRAGLARLSHRAPREDLDEWEDAHGGSGVEHALATRDLDEEVVLRGRHDHV